jgi:hypothetical protein
VAGRSAARWAVRAWSSAARTAATVAGVALTFAAVLVSARGDQGGR